MGIHKPEVGKETFEKLLTVEEIAKDLRVPKSWVYSRTRETGPNAMPRLKIGKYLRFERDKVREWAAKNAS